MMKRVLIFAGVVSVLFSASIGTAQSRFDLAIDATYAERFVWRGMPLNEESVIQPSVTISKDGFGLNVWGNMDLTDWGEEAGYGDESGRFTELDYSGYYETSVGPVNMGGGYATYTYPNQDELGLSSTTEAFLSLGLDVPLSPTVTTYLDVDEPEDHEYASYTGFDIGHSFELAEWVALDISAHLGLANHRFFEANYGIDVYHNLHDWSAGVALPVSLPKGFYIIPAYSYSSLIEPDARDAVDDDWGLDPDAWVFTLSAGWSGAIK